jgi:hypothetical protein
MTVGLKGCVTHLTTDGRYPIIIIMVIKFPRRIVFYFFSVLFILTSGFVWGFFTHKERIFPYRIARYIARSIGISTGERFERKMIQSRSKNTRVLLQALGYVDGTYDPNYESQGVMSEDEDRGDVFDSYRFYSSRTAQHAELIDILGNVVHSWRFETGEKWQAANLMPNGDVFIIVKDYELLKINRNSELIWRKSIGAHHHIDVHENEIYLLTRKPRYDDFSPFPAPFLGEYISVLSDTGELLREISLFDLLWDSEYRFLLTSLGTIDPSEFEVLDVLHSNHVEVFDGSYSHLNPMYSRGNILVCMRNINVVMVFDPKQEEIVWLWGPNNLTFPHHPTILDSGNMLIFDNGTEVSRVVELDPLSGDLDWIFSDEEFFSATRGSAQRLGNGNTLITESNTGYVFEVTRAGNEVWRFANPDVQNDGTRGAIWRMTAFEKSRLTFLEEPREARGAE